MVKLLVIASLAGLAACAGDASDGANISDAGPGGNDAGTNGCGISFEPGVDVEANAIAPIRATVELLNVSGVLTYSWSVRFGGTTVPYEIASSDGSSINFIAADPGGYELTVEITGGSASCSFTSGYINVLAPGANNNVYRLRAVPPANFRAPPQEQIIQVKGGASAIRAITLDPGLSADGFVRSGTSSGPGVEAYVKFMPISAPQASTEVYTSSTGAYATKLLGITHDVLVIPTSTALAPRLAQWTPTTTSLVVTGGTVVSGTVRNPAGTGLVGAKVQLIANGVPSTVATSTTGGAFSLRADFPANAAITVKVTPPAASGLPRLESTAQFTLTQAMQINYAATLQTCNLLNTPVRRNAVDQANAKVTVVGTLAASAGTVIAGASASALGTVRVAASADGSGRLPSMLVPRSAALTAVTQIGATDFALDGLDTSTCPSLTIEAPALQVVNGVAKAAGDVTLANVRIEASPRGALALADAQTLSVTTSSTGAFSLPLAAAGRYDVRFLDPQARVARFEQLDVTSVSVPTNAILPVALTISGHVSISGSSQLMPGTSVQLLCATCTGVDAARPVAETATNTLSDYRIAVPDPGTM